MKKKVLLWILDLTINIVVILGLVVIIQTWIIAPYNVSGQSMCDSFNIIDGECASGEGEKIIINEAGYILGDIKRGDVVVFRMKEPDQNGDKKYLIKRVIGLPNETIEIKNGKVFLEKENTNKQIELIENYLNERNKNKTEVQGNAPTRFTVPEDHYFVLGDNRKNSTDSRSCFGLSMQGKECEEKPEENAFVSRDQIRGKAWLVLWPFNNIRVVETYRYPNL